MNELSELQVWAYLSTGEFAEEDAYVPQLTASHENGTHYLTAEIQEYKYPEGYSYQQITYSYDLEEWYPIDSYEVVSTQNISSDIVRQQIRITCDPSATEPIYYRVEAVYNPNVPTP